MMLELTRLRDNDAETLAKIHLAAFPGFFLSQLGVSFLKQFYLGFSKDPSAVTVVLRCDGVAIGAAVGTVEPKNFFRRLLLGRFLPLALAALRHVVSSPSATPRLVRAIVYRGDAPSIDLQPSDAAPALLSSICIDPSLQRHGYGRLLIAEWLRAAHLKGARAAYLTTDADKNDRVNRFYAESGWQFHETFTTPENRPMNRYVRNLENPATVNALPAIARAGDRVLVIEAYEKAFVNFRERLLDELVERGCSVFAAAPTISVGMERMLDLRRISASPFFMRRAGVNPWSELRAICSLHRMFRSVQPEVVLAFGPKVVIYTGLASVMTGARFKLGVITGLGFGFASTTFKGRAIGAIQRGLYRIALRRFAVVLFQNPDDRDLFQDKHLLPHGLAVGVINGSGVDMEKFAPSPTRPATLTFLFVGRLQVGKGVREFITAAKRIAEEAPHIRFNIVGWLDEGNPDSISRTELEKVERVGNVRYLGRQEDVRTAMSECSVLVLPSYREGTPRSVLEAMAMGRAVITTDAPGCRETVSPGVNGFLVPVKDVDALVDAMRQYIANPTLAEEHGMQSLAIAREKYDVTSVNQSLLAYLPFLPPRPATPSANA